MKILIDISRLHKNALRRGVGYYSSNLFDNLSKLEDSNKYYLNKDNKLDNKEYNLIHYPHFDPFFLTLPLLRNKLTIVTVHDLTPIKFPQHFPRGIKGEIKWQVQKNLLKQVNAIITDSNNSKTDIIDLISYPAEKIHPIYLAVDEKFRKLESANWRRKLFRETGSRLAGEIGNKYQLPDNYLLYVGDINWNKNISRMLKTFYNVKSAIKNLKLVLIGNAFQDNNLAEQKEINKLIYKLKLDKDIIKLGFVPIDKLVIIYNLATLYIQPSFYEGFGLPILEAMSSGCPVLSSDQGSLPEVGGKAVEYFNPYKEDEFSNKLKSLLLNKDKLKELKLLGLNQAKKFSWQKTALETRNIYEKVLSNI